jgi:hypothetical protein
MIIKRIENFEDSSVFEEIISFNVFVKDMKKFEDDDLVTTSDGKIEIDLTSLDADEGWDTPNKTIGAIITYCFIADID